jgi:hypothetical protein
MLDLKASIAEEFKENINIGLGKISCGAAVLC